jgi:hypothetical protein
MVAHASPKLLPARHKDRDDEPLFGRRALAMVKRSARSIVRARSSERRVVLIFGCQRSGTTMLQQTFLDRSWRILILEEHDRRLVGPGPGPEETSWQEYSTVLGRIHRLPFEVVAAKPLVESASATSLMDAAGPVKAIWMIRHYAEVARSNVSRFGMDNPYRDLQPIRSREARDWRCRGVTEETWETVTAMSNRRLTPLDAAALFWWTRNQLYVDQRLREDDRIRVLRYERACNQPEEVIRSLSDHTGVVVPLGSIARRVRAQPFPPETGKLDPDVDALCRKLWDSFDGCPEL